MINSNFKMDIEFKQSSNLWLSNIFIQFIIF